MPKTKVKFLIEKDTKEEVFAYFPYEIADLQGNKMSYSHISLIFGLILIWLSYQVDVRTKLSNILYYSGVTLILFSALWIAIM